MTATDLLWLVAAGFAAGLVSVVASLASLVSYPALLAIGLPPLTANVTNTVALVFTSVGAAAGSRPELVGQRRDVIRLGWLTAAGGATGAVVLLVTPAAVFESIVPWLVAGASLVLLARSRLVRSSSQVTRRSELGLRAAVFGVAVYTGYFGAAGGVLMLAVLATLITGPFARTNALKNVISGFANAVAGLLFIVLGPVQWSAVLPLGVGFLIGGRIGPSIVRRLPGDALRIGVGLAGLGVAARLAYTTYW